MQKIFKINLKAFTLVELIIVITILAILSTIAYISFQGYTKNARDGNRVSTLKNISKGIEINQIQIGDYPFPDGKILTGTINNQQLTYKGEIKENLTRLLRINKIPTDPVTQNNYVYSITQDKKQYQIGTILEGDLVYQKLINTTYAGNYYGKIEGNYKGYLTFGSGAGNTEIWVVNIPSILYNFSGSVTYTGVDLLNQTGTYYIVEKGTNLPYAPNGIEKNNKTLNDIIKDKTKNNSAKIISISKTDLLTFIENESIPSYLGGTSTGELYSSFGTSKKEELEKLITGVSTTPPQLPGCSIQPNYTNATFTTGVPTIPNQSWQSINVNQGCHWTCGAGKVLLGENCVSENCVGTTPNGTSQVSNANSTAGGTWHYSTTDGVCTFECGAGYYYSGGNCIASSQGYYVANQGQENQTECGGNNKYQDQTGQIICKDVSSGYYTTGGTSTTRTGQAQCEAGYYCSGGVRTACGPGLTSPVGSTSIGDCVFVNYFSGAGTSGDPYRLNGIASNSTTTIATSCNYYNLNANTLTNGNTRLTTGGSCGNNSNSVCLNDGVYLVDPDGSSSAYSTMNVFCDMNTGGGGWLQVFNLGQLDIDQETIYDVGTGHDRKKFSDALINIFSVNKQFLIKNKPYTIYSIVSWSGNFRTSNYTNLGEQGNGKTYSSNGTFLRDITPELYNSDHHMRGRSFGGYYRVELSCHHSNCTSTNIHNGTNWGGDMEIYSQVGLSGKGTTWYVK